MNMLTSAKNSVSTLLSKTRSAGKDLSDGLESIRKRIRDLQDDRLTIEHSPPPQEVAFARVDAFVASLGGSTFSAKAFAAGPESYSQPRPMDRVDPFIGWVSPHLAEAIKREVEALYQASPGMTDDERAARLEAIDREILDAELAEESLIRAAEAGGFLMARRYDADPRAVLADAGALP